ncbi:hypothetical protein [Pseudonocardia sp. GCM10023141]|uniref:hypothetical protein n=1 Tax=Pseudonocardia sp. GCM10023141 TaxID=3252653 RepID=UPI00360741EF
MDELQGQHSPGAAIDDLLAAAGHGDVDAFAAFYDLTAAMVFGLMRGALGKETDVAEQATARAYLQVWRSAPSFHPSDGPATALLLISAWRELAALRDDTRPRSPSVVHAITAASPDCSETT